MMKLLSALLVLLFASNSFAATTIVSEVIRNESGSGDTFVSCGFPFPSGLVTEQIIQDGTIRIIIDGVEVAANVSALRGRHRDGTVRSALIQFTTTLTQGVPVSAQVVVGDGARASADPAYVRPTLAHVQANNVIVATSPTYLCSTFATFQNLLPEGNGTSSEEKQLTTLAENRFDALVAAPNFGTASYEDARGMIAMWQRTGDYKYHRQAVLHAQDWLPYNTPTDPGSCPGQNVMNPDGRIGINGSCGIWNEPYYARFMSYAALYLLTGYRDFWGLVDYAVQWQHARFSSQTLANAGMISHYDPRFSFAFGYAAIAPSYHIGATFPVNTQTGSGRSLDFSDQFTFSIGALQEHAWDIMWIPFSGGSGSIPAVGTTISQGSVSAEFLAVGEHKGFVLNSTMPSTGYIQIKKSSLAGGSFAAGAITGITATATGVQEDDYRNGYLGMYSYKPESTEETPAFQAIFPVNFLIDQYLYVYADSRIPEMVETNVNIVLQTIQSVTPVDYTPWGTLEYGHPYALTNPIGTSVTPWTLPEFARALAFLIKTVGDNTVNGKTYSEWYEVCINTANNAPQHLTWQWKLWGQFYGMSQDAPWIMAQDTLSGPSMFVEPTQYDEMIGETPDVYRTSGGGEDPDPTPTTTGPVPSFGGRLLSTGGRILVFQ